MSEAVETPPAEIRALSNAELTKEVTLLRRVNNELNGQVQNLTARLNKLDRDIRMLAAKRR